MRMGFIVGAHWKAQMTTKINIHRANNKTRAPRYGRMIGCPECDKSTRVYHFGWSALMCDWCKADVPKHAWKIIKPVGQDNK